jgi:Ca2+-binding RTX toxin-like protein
VATGDGNDNVNLADFFFRKISVAGGRGDDTLYVSNHNGTPAHMDGGPGNDDITTNLQLGAEPVLHGGTGDDTLTILNAVGGLEYGDAGNDRLVYRGFTLNFHFPLVLGGGSGTTPTPSRGSSSRQRWWRARDSTPSTRAPPTPGRW